tara:strand:- start:207 stop:368 length:162 start_codon:yes stop_codon:yes gene_type:complete
MTALQTFNEKKVKVSSFNCESIAIENIALALVIAADRIADSINEHASATRFQR